MNSSFDKFLVVLTILLLNQNGFSQESEFNQFSIEVGVNVATQFIDKSYNYSGSYGNNTLGGFGGLILSGLYRKKYRLQVGFSNLDEYVLGSGNRNGRSFEKNFSNTVSFSRVMSKQKYDIDFGITYLYVYERITFASTPNRLGSQFTSNDHYLGVFFGAKFKVVKSFGPFVNYHLIPLRISNEGASGYSHNLSLGLSFKIK